MKREILKLYKNLNLNKKIRYTTLVSFFAMFVLCFAVITAFFTYREKELSENRLIDMYERIDARLNHYMDEIDMSAYTVMCSKWVQQLLNETGFSTSAEMQMYRKNASHFLSSYSSMYDNLKCVIFSEDQSYIKSNNSFNVRQGFDIREQEWYGELEKEEKYRELDHSSMLTERVGKDSLTVYYIAKNIYTFQNIGYFAVNLEYGQFQFVSEMLNENEYVLIRNQNGQTVFSNMEEREELLEKINSENGEISGSSHLRVYEEKVMEDGWTIWLLTENPTVFESVRRHLYIFLIIIPVIFVFLGISLLMSRYLTEPIVKCTEAFREVQNKNFEICIQHQYTDEIGGMLDGFNEMTRNIKRLIEQNQLMYQAHQQAELKILQQRINPHFLCNTLEIINGMILLGDSDQAIELTGMLGKMYRYDLGEDDIVPVREELSYLKNYLDILAYKYRNLQVAYQIEPEVLDMPLLKFICQPLVENSLKHGFCKRAGNERIEIGIRLLNGNICIIIQDNGNGMKETVLEELREKIAMLKKNQAAEINDYIGVLNTARRIFLQYGRECVFEIESSVVLGTRTEIQIPVKE